MYSILAPRFANVHTQTDNGITKVHLIPLLIKFLSVQSRDMQLGVDFTAKVKSSKTFKKFPFFMENGSYLLRLQ